MQQITETLYVPLEHPAYSGHFPDHPIVPGALLLRWLQLCIEQCLPHWTLQAVTTAKFLAEVKPGDCLQLSATFDDQTGRLTLSAKRSDTLVCKAALLLTETGVG